MIQLFYHFLLLVYSLIVGFPNLYILFIPLWMIIEYAIKYFLVSSDLSQSNRTDVKTHIEIVILILVIVMIFVDVERTQLMYLHSRSLQSVGNENSFFNISSNISLDIYNSHTRIYSLLRLYLVEDKYYILLTTFLQYISLIIFNINNIQLNILPNIFAGALSSLFLYLHIIKTYIGNESIRGYVPLIALIIINPAIVQFSVVGLRDIYVLLVLAYIVYLFSKDYSIVSKLIVLIPILFITYHIRVFSFLLILEYIFIIYILRDMPKNKKVITAIILTVGFAMIYDLSIDYSSQLANNDVRAIISKYKLANDQNTTSITITLMKQYGNMIFPFLFIYVPYFTELIKASSIYTYISGLNAFIWNMILSISIILMIFRGRHRNYILANNHILASIFIIVQISFLSAEYRHKMPFQIILFTELIGILSRSPNFIKYGIKYLYSTIFIATLIVIVGNMT